MFRPCTPVPIISTLRASGRAQACATSAVASLLTSGAATEPDLTIEGSMESIVAMLVGLPQEPAQWQGDGALLEALRERVSADSAAPDA